MWSKKRGFTLIEIMIVVAIIGILVAIAIPGFLKARETSQRNVCLQNLMQIDGAKTRWALYERKGGDDIVSLEVLADPEEGYLSSVPKCPALGIYDVGIIDVQPKCSIETHEPE